VPSRCATVAVGGPRMKSARLRPDRATPSEAAGVEPDYKGRYGAWWAPLKTPYQDAVGMPYAIRPSI
jgi:hypothetical protein